MPWFPTGGRGVRAHVGGVRDVKLELDEALAGRDAIDEAGDGEGEIFSGHGAGPRVGLVDAAFAEHGDGLFGAERTKGFGVALVVAHEGGASPSAAGDLEGLESERELASLAEGLDPRAAHLLAGLLHQHGLERADVMARVAKLGGDVDELGGLGAAPEQGAERLALEGVERAVVGVRGGERGRVVAAAGHARALRRADPPAGRRALAHRERRRRRGVDRQRRLTGRVEAAHGERGGRPLGTREEFEGRATTRGRDADARDTRRRTRTATARVTYDARPGHAPPPRARRACGSGAEHQETNSDADATTSHRGGFHP